MADSRFGARYGPGDTIQGRWRIRSTVGGHGQSGMGIVYIADDLRNDRLVAIKTFQPERVADETIRALLVREANAWLAMGHHPNIVELETVEQYGTQVFLFMEYIRPDAAGRNTLTDYLDGEPLPPSRVADWALQICEAMIHMRACGIEMHRDLKPANFMITADGVAKVTDFGLARAYPSMAAAATSSDDCRPAVSLVGKLAGTPGYMAPEIVLGQAQDVRSDIYAFGLVLVQMITGESSIPLTGQWQGDLMTFERANLEIRHEKAPPTDRSAFHGVVCRCLSIDPVNRFEHFVALARALRSACTRHNIVATSGSGVPDATNRAPSAIDRDAHAAEVEGLGGIHALIRLGRLQEALVQVRDLRSAEPYDPALLDLEGTVLTHLGRTERAIELLEAACEIDPDSSSHWNNLGRALREAGNSSAALESFDRALALDDSPAGVWVNRAICLDDLGRLEESLVGFDHALSLDPHYVFALLGRANALHRLGRRLDAIAALEDVFEVEPGNADAARLYEKNLNALRSRPPQRSLEAARAFARTASAEENYRAGLDAIREARLRFGGDAALWNDEGVCLTGLGELPAALRCFDRALRGLPDRTDTLANKGRALRLMGRAREALPVLDKAIELAPGEWHIWIDKCACLRDLGRKDEALAAFRRGDALARQQGASDACEAMAPAESNYVSAQALLTTLKFVDAARFARSVPSPSMFYSDAFGIAAQAALGLAREKIDAGLTDAGDTAAVLDMLQRAVLELDDAETRAAASVLLERALNESLDRHYQGFVENDDLDGAENLLRRCIAPGADGKRVGWARSQLAIVLANRAVGAVEAEPRWRPAAAAWLGEAQSFAAEPEEIEALTRELLGERPYAWSTNAAPAGSARARLATRLGDPFPWWKHWDAVGALLARLQHERRDAADTAMLDALRTAAAWLGRTDPGACGPWGLDLRQACKLAVYFGKTALATRESDGLCLPAPGEIEPLVDVVELCCALFDSDEAVLAEWPEFVTRYRARASAPEPDVVHQPRVELAHGSCRFDLVVPDKGPDLAHRGPIFFVPPAEPLQAAGLLPSGFLASTTFAPAGHDAIRDALVRCGEIDIWLPPSILAGLNGKSLHRLQLNWRGIVEPVYVIV